MNKKAIICTVAILILLVGASVIYFIMDRSSEAETENSSSMSNIEPESSNSQSAMPSDSQAENESQESASETTSSEVNSPEADALIRTFAEIGEPYTLHSRYYNQGEAKTEDAPWLGWDGDLELCITDAIVKEYEESDIKYNSDSSIWARYASDFEDPCILHVELSLKNVDAENKNGVKYKFNANMFVLSAYEDLLPENQNNPEGYTTVGNYYSAYETYFDPHGPGDDYWSFELQPGETQNFTIEFLIDRVYLSQKDPFLAITPGREIFYGVMLRDLANERIAHMKSLRHFLQNELYNLFHSKSFLFVLLILLLIVTADDILAYKSYKDNLQLTLTTVDLQADGTFAEYPFLQIYTLYNSWIGGRANETLPMVFFYTMPVLSLSRTAGLILRKKRTDTTALWHRSLEKLLTF